MWQPWSQRSPGCHRMTLEKDGATFYIPYSGTLTNWNYLDQKYSIWKWWKVYQNRKVEQHFTYTRKFPEGSTRPVRITRNMFYVLYTSSVIENSIMLTFLGSYVGNKNKKHFLRLTESYLLILWGPFCPDSMTWGTRNSIGVWCSVCHYYVSYVSVQFILLYSWIKDYFSTWNNSMVGCQLSTLETN